MILKRYLVGGAIALVLSLAMLAVGTFFGPRVIQMITQEDQVTAILNAEVTQIDSLPMPHGTLELFESNDDEHPGYIIRWMPDYTAISFVSSTVMYTEPELGSLAEIHLFTDKEGLAHVFRVVVKGGKFLSAQDISQGP
jgi:hypothetical protein